MAPRGLERQPHGFADPEHFVDGELVALPDHRGVVLALDVLHRVEVVPFRLPGPEDLDDVVVDDAGQEGGFAVEALDELGIGRQVALEDLDGGRPIEGDLATQVDGAVSLVETTVPAPVTFRGTPAPRYWEMEDAQIDYGSMQVGPTDLAHMLLIEYASSYGNDWFVVPLTLPVGSLTRIDSLVVTDSFGVRSLLRPIGDPSLPRPNWSMWQMTYRRHPGEDPIANPAANLFFLPPTTGQRLQGAALEDVLFMRDEMANLAWAIERSIESPLEQPMPRIERTEAPNDAATSSRKPPRYLLASTVPGHWIPLLPVQTHDASGRIVSRLRRGAVLQPDGTQKLHVALSEVLKAAGERLLYDEEVPREGQHVTRLRVVARWIDGSTWLWTAFRKQVGRGEGSSGLAFDRLQDDGNG